MSEQTWTSHCKISKNGNLEIKSTKNVKVVQTVINFDYALFRTEKLI